MWYLQVIQIFTFTTGITSCRSKNRRNPYTPKSRSAPSQRIQYTHHVGPTTSRPYRSAQRALGSSCPDHLARATAIGIERTHSRETSEHCLHASHKLLKSGPSARLSHPARLPYLSEIGRSVSGNVRPSLLEKHEPVKLLDVGDACPGNLPGEHLPNDNPEAIHVAGVRVGSFGQHLDRSGRGMEPAGERLTSVGISLDPYRGTRGVPALGVS